MEVLKSTLETMQFKLGIFFFFILHISILGYTHLAKCNCYINLKAKRHDCFADFQSSQTAVFEGEVPNVRDSKSIFGVRNDRHRLASGNTCAIW